MITHRNNPLPGKAQYLEIFYNRQRRHSALGMLTPIEYKRLHPTGLHPTKRSHVRSSFRGALRASTFAVRLLCLPGSRPVRCTPGHRGMDTRTKVRNPKGRGSSLAGKIPQACRTCGWLPL